MQRTFAITNSRAAPHDALEMRGQQYQGKRIDWSRVLESQRILLIAEAGAGKTYECKAQAELLVQEGEPAFFLHLEEVATSGVRLCLYGESTRRFDDWRTSSSQVAYFFLDSIDELQLAHRDFCEALRRLSDDLQGGLGRATIVITSRPVDIDRKAFAQLLPVPAPATEPNSEAFVQAALEGPKADGKKPPLPFLEITLLPLSDEDIVEFARGQGVSNPDELLAAIHARHAGDFARRPQDLIELCDDWRDVGRIRSHFDQVRSHIDVRLSARDQRRERADLTLERAREGAERLALASMLSRRLTIRHSAGADVEGSGDFPLRPAELLADFSSNEIATLLQRPIFTEGGYGRVRFHHRSVLEFLAASKIHHMIESGTLAVSAAKRLLFSFSDTQELLPKPSMRAVAGWLALLRQDIFDAVLEVEPGTLMLYGDPESLSDRQCERALQAFVQRYGMGQWRGLEVPDLQLDRLACKPLHDVILDAWAAGIENPEVREVLVRLIASGRYAKCADLAAHIAGDTSAGDRERFEALNALSELRDDRLDWLIQAAISLQLGWNARIARWIGVHFYPEHVDEDQLVRLLTQVQREIGDHDVFASSMARVIEHADVRLDRLEALLPGLLALTQSLMTVDEDDVLGECKRRLQTSFILRALCIRLLEGRSDALALDEAAVLAYRAGGRRSHDDEGKRRIAKLLDGLPAERRRQVFNADYACATHLARRDEARSIAGHLWFDGPIQYSYVQDHPWIMAELADAAADGKRRAVLLRIAIVIAPSEDANGAMTLIREAVADSPALSDELAQLLKDREPSPEMLAMQAEQHKREERLRRKTADNRAEWTAFWTELAERPALALAPGRNNATILNLWKVLRRNSRGYDGARWDRTFLEQCFSASVTDALRRSLMGYWRGMTPSLRSERAAAEEDTIPVVWLIGLMGIYAEAEDPRWARTLREKEAELAARYALLEANSLPDWLSALTDAHPKIVEGVLGAEIDHELGLPSGGGGWHSMLLQNLRYARPEIARLLQDRLTAWLAGPGQVLMRAPHHPAAEAKLGLVIRVLLAHGDPLARYWLREIATQQASAAGHGPFLFFWLPVLFRLAPARGTALLLRLLDQLPVENQGVAVKAIGSLFCEHRVDGKTDWSKALTAQKLLELTRAIYHHVRPSDDVRHDGVYSPNSRDWAENGRRHVFDALIRATGADAFEAKLTLASDPMFAHTRDRIAALAHERLAEEADASLTSMTELARLFRGGELAPMTSTDMAYLLSNRLDDLQDLMLRDAGPRAVWAQAKDENSLRFAVAHQLDSMSKGAYTLDQEAVTADGKETDIRLRSCSGYQATIELKIGEKTRSGKDLRDTIENQLVKKYMAARNARTGCLLVAVADPNKRWTHPDTGALLGRLELEQMLGEAAQQAQQRLGGDARVMARILDLAPRLAREPRRATAPGSAPSASYRTNKVTGKGTGKTKRRK